MILAALDDLMFTSRIRAAAQGVGATVRFAKDPAALAELARQEQPALLLIDLNARLFDPMAVIRQFKSDPELARIRSVGFVSHVQTDVIGAAREAGIDEVMARSAFVSKLPALLGGTS